MYLDVFIFTIKLQNAHKILWGLDLSIFGLQVVWAGFDEAGVSSLLDSIMTVGCEIVVLQAVKHWTLEHAEATESAETLEAKLRRLWRLQRQWRLQRRWRVWWHRNLLTG